MKTKTINGDEYVRLSDIYEWTLGKLERNEFSLEDQKVTLERLSALNYLKKLMRDKPIMMGMMNEVIKGIKNETIPSDYMSISYIYYLCTEAGIDTKELQDVIDSNADKIVSKYLSDGYSNFLKNKL